MSKNGMTARANTNRIYGRPAQAWIGGQPRPVWVVSRLHTGRYLVAYDTGRTIRPHVVDGSDLSEIWSPPRFALPGWAQKWS